MASVRMNRKNGPDWHPLAPRPWALRPKPLPGPCPALARPLLVGSWPGPCPVLARPWSWPGPGGWEDGGGRDFSDLSDFPQMENRDLGWIDLGLESPKTL